jgi:hypothetical protein
MKSHQSGQVSSNRVYGVLVGEIKDGSASVLTGSDSERLPQITKFRNPQIAQITQIK